MKSNCKLIQLKVFVDVRGSLVALEQHNNVPFDIRRVYYIFDTKEGISRGFHAHKELEQMLICVSGTCKVKLDDGKMSKIFTLSSPQKALYIGKNIWREMFDFSKDCVLMVVASECYNPMDYIRDYKEFLKSSR